MAIKPAKLTRAAVLAQLANGVDPASLTEEPETETPETEEPAAPKAEAEQTETQEPEAPAAPVVTDAPVSAQLLDLTRQNAKLELKVESLQAEVDVMKNASTAACGVIRTAVERLGIALGSTVIGLEDASLSTLCAQFTKLDAEFGKKFPVGGVTRPLASSETAVKPLGNELSHRVTAARKTTKRN